MTYLTDEPSTTNSTRSPASGSGDFARPDTSRPAKLLREISQSSQEPISGARSVSMHSQASESGITLYGSQDGLQMSLFGPEAAPASRSVLPGESKEQKTNDTFGRNGADLLTSVDLQSSLGNKLRPLLAGRGSTLFRLTWKDWVTPAGRPICALRASVLRTSGNGFFSWLSPTKDDAGRQGSEGMAEKWAAGEKIPFCHQRLRTQVKLTTWPTPDAHGMNIHDTQWEKRREKYRQKYKNNGFGLTLGMAVQLAPYPTPRAIDGRSKGNGPRPDTLTGLMTYNENKEQRKVSGETLSGSSAVTEKPAHLNPEHARWLMGLPRGWGSCAPMAMPSPRKLRQRSLKRR